jgi:hypothetical protein
VWLVMGTKDANIRCISERDRPMTPGQVNVIVADVLLWNQFQTNDPRRRTAVDVEWKMGSVAIPVLEICSR